MGSIRLTKEQHYKYHFGNKKRINMPEYICPECGRKYTGWALKFKKCYCDCGNWLNWDLFIPKE